MNKKTFAAMALAAMTAAAHAGVTVDEGFDNVAGLTAQGWTMVNSSTPGGATNWFQGEPGVFAAYSGAPSSYIAANFANAGEGGVIDNVLTTPTFDASQGVDISFYLRAGAAGPDDDIGYGFSGGAFTIVSAIPASAWTRYTVHLDAGIMGMTRFTFQYFGTYDTSNYVGIDSLAIHGLAPAAVPEPASLALFAAGLLGLGALRRRSQR